MTKTEIPKPWADLLARIKKRQSSPVLMPSALLALLDLAESGKVKDGVVKWQDFKAAFESTVSEYAPDKRKEAWRPFYHLSGQAGLWSLLKNQKPASFSDLKKGKPASGSGLEQRVDSAIVTSDLLPPLSEPAKCERIRLSILQRMPNSTR